jgi:peptide/nickel transport system substrate-binding protein
VKVRSRRISLLAVIAASLAMFVAACGGNDNGGGGGGGSNAKPTKEQEASATKQIDINEQPLDKVKQGGTVRWAVDQFSTQWNYNQVNGPEASTAQVLYGTMPYVFIADKTATVNPNPDYLTSAKAENTGGKQIVTLELNPKAKWSDGTPITEKDYETQWKALQGKNSAYQIASSTGYDQIESVKQGKDQNEVIATFSKPFADWKALWSPLYPAKYQDSVDHFNKGYLNKIPVTGGPFKIEKIDKTAKTVSMVPDPAWWGAKPKVDRIITRALEGDAGVNAFVNGEVDVNLIPNDPSSYKRAAGAKNGVVRVAGGPDFRHFTFNGTSPNLKDQNVRQAIAMGINRNAIVKADLTGLPWPARTMDNHFLVNTQAGYKSNSGAVGTFNPDKAKQMLDAAGWKQGSNGFRTKGGKTLDVRFVIPTGVPASKQEGELTQAMLKDIGVKLDIRAVPSDDFFDKYVIPGNYDITPFAWLGTPFPISSSKSIYANPTKDDKGELQIQQNFARVGSQEIDDLMDKANQSLDQQQAFNLINQADVKIWDLVHSIVFYQRPQMTAVNKNLANVGSYGFAQPDYTKIGFVNSPS